MDFSTLISGFGGFAWVLMTFVVALSIIVAIHEYGHYIVGRWSGIDAEVFSVGFGPVIWSRVDKRGTRWQIAALPFGGFVKFLGDANAASAPDASTEKARNTMHGAPLWARAATVAAGPIFNFVFAFILFSILIWTQGQPSDPLTVATLRPVPLATQQVEPGDEILSIAGQITPSLDEFDGYIAGLPVEDALEYRVMRDGQEVTVTGPYPFPPLAVGITPDSAADDAELISGDVVVAIDGTPIVAFDELLQTTKNSEGRALDITVWRDGDLLEFVLVPRRVDLPMPDGSFDTRWMIGIAGGLFFEPVVEPTPILTSLWGGVQQTYFILRSSLNGLGAIITGGISSCNISGPIGIAEAAGDTAERGLESFVRFIAVISAAIGLMNLFPIPVLDGGHLVFHAYEAITGSPPSNRALQVLMTIGLVLMVALMIFAVTNDLFCP